MKDHIRISGFKCFENSDFELNKITALTGSNGTGKSSLIQAILLVRLAIELNNSKSRLSNYNISTDWNDILVPLNNGYELQLGTIGDIIRENDTLDSDIKISLNNEDYLFSLPEEFDINTSLQVNLTNKFKPTKETPFWRKNEFYYLHTERLGPRHSLDINSTDFIHCGYKGEYTAQVLFNVSRNAKFRSAMIGEKSKPFDFEVNKWLNLVCPGIIVTAAPLGTLSAQIRVSSSAAKSDMLATNIGFGISYALPIIISGLIAKKGCMFIVENPEAHLHPKGQSNIGYFLSRVASSGVKVLCETHSEHVINGIRKGVLEDNTISNNDVSIYFFNGFKENKMNIDLIEIEENGNLTKFPLDFFDQTNQDLAKIFKLINKDG